MNKLIFIIAIVLGLGNISYAQGALTIESAIQIAHTNNPGLKAALLQVEKEKALLKTNISVEKTDFSYSMGQINSDMIDYSIGVNQSFKFPSSGAKKKLLQAKVAAGETNLEIAKSELNRSIRTEFVAIYNLQEQLVLFKEQESIYETMFEIATKRLQVGESNILEKSIADSKFQEVKIAREKIEMDITAHSTNLSLLLYSKIQPISISQESTVELPLVDTTKIGANPMLAFYQNTIDIQEKEVSIKKKEYFPDFNLGYFNQQIDGTQGYQGVQIGLAIPLFNRNQKAMVNASKLEVDIANQEMENYRLTLHQLFQKQIQNHNKYYLEVAYYNTKGEALANQIAGFANKAYQQGDIGYVEYLQNVNQAKQIKVSYLESLQKYHSEIIGILYLTGQ